MPIIESEITLTFPDDNFFRFEDCSGYKTLSHIKEMDACWYDKENNILYVIELKNWQNNQLIEENDPNISIEEIERTKQKISEHRLYELCKKSFDSVYMFSSILLKKPYSSKLQECIPFEIAIDTKIVLLSIINWTDTNSTYISLVNTKYKTMFKSYAKLFDINTYLVITKEQASRIFNWVT